MEDEKAAPNNSVGVLVGWSHHPIRDNLALRLQSTRSSRLRDPEEVDVHDFVLTKNQARILAHYLTQVAGGSAIPKKRSGFLRRFLRFS